ncbi:DUF4386 family protein [Thalassotalea sp. ND16A]|uniref:DUF4386 family protein n=1 Tax=Thalassotalea sp. ND16A TaxID=1535422 RepID=UPI00051A30FF|nr:DUF4386 family protein [Thalassotalea sp. ND16A]KGJ93366.1 hypothetical protein ND16A_1524 [Thalassotalea sp. ND16A]
MNNLQRIGGVAALSEAVIYISAFIFFGAFWDFPANAAAVEKFSFLADNQIILSIVNLTMYVVFGIFLAVLVLALHQRVKNCAPALSQIASVFGIIWVGLIIASGMIANIGLAAVIEISVKAPEQAMTVWLTINAIIEGLGGGNEIVGGLWVLLLSIAALKANQLPKVLNYLGLCIGCAGILTIYPAEVLTEIFGLGQIAWFAWLGIIMVQKPSKPSKQTRETSKNVLSHAN